MLKLLTRLSIVSFVIVGINGCKVVTEDECYGYCPPIFNQATLEDLG